MENSESKTIIPVSLTKLLPPKNLYHIEQMKNGISIANVSIEKNRIIFGRARDCDVTMDHPSISRYHAALLWSPKNDDDYENGSNTESFWYLIDCGSTHGTVCNKNPVNPGKMIKITPNNNVFRFGASTRLFTLCSRDDQDDDVDPVDQINQIESSNKKSTKLNENEDPDVCTWGISMTDCNDDDDDDDKNVDSIALKSIIEAMKNGQSSLKQSPNENVFIDNPYKCLQQWFEHEGYDFDYKIDTINNNNNKFKCTIELPIDGHQWITIDSDIMMKKKDSISNACLRCCKLLDQANLLFQWQRKDREHLKHKHDSDSDDDDLIDETITLKKKKKNDNNNKIDNYETLNLKWKEINQELCKQKIRLANIDSKNMGDNQIENQNDNDDELDVYMKTLNNQQQKKYGLTHNEKIEKSNLKIKIKQLEQEQIELEKLIQLAKPIEIKMKNNSITTTTTASSSSSSSSSTTLTTTSSTGSELKPSSSSNDSELKPSSSSSTDSILKPSKDVTDKKNVETKKLNYKEQRKQQQQSIIDSIEKEKQNLLKKQQQQQQSIPQQSTIDDSYNEDNFIDWIKLDNQNDDGRIPLNDKFGY